MQQQNKNIKIFRKAVGEVLLELIKSTDKSISLFAREFDFDRGNLSKITRGLLSCRLDSIWKLAEASGISFTEFAKRLQDKLGDDFSLIDD